MQQVSKSSSGRLLNFEVLRSILMVMIIFIHLFGHGMERMAINSEYNFHLFNTWGWINFSVSEIIDAISHTAVNIYIFITGYFLITNHTLRFNKILYIWLETVFYSVVITSISYFTTGDVSLHAMATAFIPVKSTVYWFVTNYLALLLLAPFLSKLCSSLTKRQYLWGLAILTLLMTEMIKFPYGYTYGNLYGVSLLFFVLLYCIGGFFKLHGNIINNKFAGIFLVILIFAIYIYHSVSINSHGFIGIPSASPYHSWTFILSILLFQWYKDLKIGNNIFTRLLVNAAPYSFAVYLIHDHPIIREFLWNHWIRFNGTVINSNYYIPLLLFIPLAIFTLCCCIDVFRDWLFRILRLKEVTNKYGTQISLD